MGGDLAALPGVKLAERQRPTKSAVVRGNHPRKIAKQVTPATTRKSTKLGVVNASRTLTAQEPARKAEYFHGVAMGLTLDRVSTRADITAKAKAIAMTLASHFPRILPSKTRLSRLTGLSRATVTRALIELRDKHLLSWTRGNSSASNRYECLWLTG